MARRQRKASLARQALELSVAAPQVVAHRVSRLAKAGTRPTATDRKELKRMATEKVIGFYQGWAALWTQAFAQQVRLVGGIPAAALATVKGDPRSAVSVLVQLPGAMADIASAGLAPIHQKAVANAKRLSRRRKSAAVLTGRKRRRGSAPKCR